MLELYHFGIDVSSQKVGFVLAEKGLDYVPHFVNLREREQYKPEYTRLNPNASLPTLIHDGTVVIESNIIMYYLEDAFPEPSLKPKSPLDRMRMNTWMNRADKIHPSNTVITLATVTGKRNREKPADELERDLGRISNVERREWFRRAYIDGVDSPDFAPAIKELDGMLGDIEDALAAGAWLAGDIFSLADAAVFPFIVRLQMLEFSEMWTLSRPRMVDWVTRIRQRPSFETAIASQTEESHYRDFAAAGSEGWPRVKELLSAAN